MLCDYPETELTIKKQKDKGKMLKFCKLKNNSKL